MGWSWICGVCNIRVEHTSRLACDSACEGGDPRGMLRSRPAAGQEPHWQLPVAPAGSSGSSLRLEHGWHGTTARYPATIPRRPARGVVTSALDHALRLRGERGLRGTWTIAAAASGRTIYLFASERSSAVAE